MRPVLPGKVLSCKNLTPNFYLPSAKRLPEQRRTALRGCTLAGALGAFPPPGRAGFPSRQRTAAGSGSDTLNVRHTTPPNPAIQVVGG